MRDDADPPKGGRDPWATLLADWGVLVLILLALLCFGILVYVLLWLGVLRSV